MKNKYILGIGILTLISSLALSSCNSSDFLEVTPKDQLTDATVWTDPASVDMFLNDIYGSLPNVGYDPDRAENLSDNNNGKAAWATFNYGLSNSVLPSSNNWMLYDYWNWDANYKKIRKCNVFIKHVKETQSLSADYKKQRLAEARFLRAFYYHVLLMGYGGVPLITVPLNNNEQSKDEILYPRSTIAQTANFISAEMDTIVSEDNGLPIKYNQSDANAGRATKGAALAIKGWVDLFAASPIPNTTNDQSKWKKAADTNAKFIKEYGGGHPYDLFSDLRNIFTGSNKYNCEIIFDRETVPSSGLFNPTCMYGGPVWVKGKAETWGGWCPLQSLVDDYAMANGLPIADPKSGYDPQNPYTGREKRFYDDIIYDGAVWQGDTIKTRIGVGSKNQIDFGNADGTQTGYYFRKTIDESVEGSNSSASNYNYVYYRYAEVLLNFAEAQNESAGPSAIHPDAGISAIDAVNKIRQRSQLPTLQNTYGKSDFSKDELRNIIIRERRVEFSMENKRYFDLRRWGLAEKYLNSPRYGTKIEKVNGKWTYTVFDIHRNMIFTHRSYWWPVPQYAIDQNEKMRGQNGGSDGWVNGQNPGY